jgi:hypothetical protein
MAMKVYVTEAGSKRPLNIVEGNQILRRARGTGKDTAIELKELFAAIRQSVVPVLDDDGTLDIELTGSISLRLEGGVSFPVFHLSGEAAATRSTRVLLSTKLHPRPGNR